MKLRELSKNIKEKGIYIIFILLAISIIGFVLFKYPMQGVADQGDFDRVMSASGLSLMDADRNNPDFIRFYSYIVTDYKISPSFISVILGLISSSIVYPIRIISFICGLLGSDTFKTQYLAIAYGIIYVAGFAFILKGLNIKNKFKFAILSILILFVFFDGNYLIWFNSLYGEPIMITTCILFIGTVLNYINNKYMQKTENKLFQNIIYVLITAFLFLTSKMQVITAIPFILVLICKILWDNKNALRRKQFIVLSLMSLIVVTYPVLLNKTNGNISHDTQYNSVFYGVLNGSPNPKQDLIDMGLNPDMSVEAGKHSYLEASEYVKYIPRTEITEEEFYSKMSNGKLAKFYLTHPLRLLQGMEYTASKAYITSTSLGKTYREYSEEPITELNRFTNWSNFRENYLPAKLWFIVGVYLMIFLISLAYFIKNKENKALRYKILLLWCMMFVGAIQFPMPYVGNGRADTAKQLFLFNFIFDIMIVTSIGWICFKVIDVFNSKK